MSDERLAYLRELVVRDQSLVAEVHELDELARATAEVRGRAEQILAVLATEQDERERLARGVTEAEVSLAERAAELEVAEQGGAEAERGGSDERRAEAARRSVRARDAHVAADQLLAGHRSHLAVFEESVAAARQDKPIVERQTSELASTLHGRPRIPETVAAVSLEGLGEVSDWAVSVRAALAVARTGAAAERDAALRQAIELGTVILGEDVVATSAAAVVARVEAAVRR